MNKEENVKQKKITFVLKSTSTIDKSSSKENSVSPSNIDNSLSKSDALDWKAKINLSQRDEEWLTLTDVRLESVTKQMVRLVNHSHVKVRLELVHAIRLLLHRSHRYLKHSIGYLIDALIILSQDENLSVAKESKETLQEFGSFCEKSEGRKLVDTVEKSFRSLIIKLPRILHGNDLVLKENGLLLVSGYLDILSKSHVSILLRSSQILGRFIESLKVAATLNSSSITLMEEISMRGVDMKTVNTNEDSWKRLKYCDTDTAQSNLKKICVKLMEYSDIDILINSFIDSFVSDVSQRKETTLLLMYLFSSGSAGFLSDHISLVEDVLDVIMDSSLWNAPLSLNEEGSLPREEIQANIVQVCLLAESVACLAVASGPEAFSPLLFKTLYPLLECAGSPLYVVATAGLVSLQKVAEGYGGVASLVALNVDYLSHNVCTRLRRLSADSKVLGVLAVLMNHSNLNVLPSLHEIIDKVLVQSCDSFQDINASSFLNVFHVYVSCILNLIPVKRKPKAERKSVKSWITMVEEYVKEIEELTAKSQEADNVEERPEEPFRIEPELLEEPLEPEPELPVIPDHVKLTIDILSRSLHFLPSNEPARQILVLQILDKGVQITSEFTNELLPIVHKIWSPLVERFKSSTHPLLLQRAFALLQTLAIYSKDFIRARTLKQVLPMLFDFLKSSSSESAKKSVNSAYTLTQKYKLQLYLLKGLGRLALDLDLSAAQLHNLLEACKPYLSNTQPLTLQEACITLYKEVAEEHADLVWIYLMSVYPHPLELSSHPQLPVYKFEKPGRNLEFEAAVLQILTEL